MKFQTINARLQTAEHILFKILINRYKAKPRSVRYETEKCLLDVISKIDLSKITPEEFESAVNGIIAKNLEVKKYFLPREEAKKIVDLSLVPKSAEKIRIVDIVGFDRQACAGNHVDNTSEIGKVKILNIERKGKDTYRFYFTLEETRERKNTQSKKTQFQTPKGTRDFLPEEMLLRQQVIEKIKSIFELYGFSPLETPAIEAWDVLSAKGAGGEEILKEAYCFEDKGKRKVGLRYDLTVPLARVIASNPNLALPLKRYQIEKVWRYGDVSKGRMREFLQCDIDTIGSASMLADAEIIACTVDIFNRLGFKDFYVRINNRKILTALMKYVEIREEEMMNVLRTIDKLDKIGLKGVEMELKDLKISEGSIKKILEFIKTKGKPEEAIKKAKSLLGDFVEGREGACELEELLCYLKKMGVYSKVKIDLSLARGLDYYTGPIFEVFAAERIGSLAGGGRYDKMIGLFLGRDVPATGISLGIERIIEVMKDRKILKPIKTKTKAFVVAVSEDVRDKALEITQNLRKNDILSDVDVKGRTLTRQLEYVDSLAIPYAIIVGKKELSRNRVKIKDMKQKKEIEIKLNELVDFLKRT